MRRLGPDASRYLQAAQGHRQTRPFNVRVLLPAICGPDLQRWWYAWGISWFVLAIGMIGWATARGLDWPHAVTAMVLAVGLPGILGPQVSIPVQVDLPATALTVVGVALATIGNPYAIAGGLVLIGIAGSIRETSPVWAALWLWSPWPLLALLVPLVISRIRRPATSSGVPEWDWIAAHPIRAGLKYHQGRWRSAHLMVLPWGACLIALGAPTWQLGLVVAVAYGQLLIATDTVRLYQHAAGPLVAIAAATVLPTHWLLPAAVLHLFWLVTPERI